jgi:polynucleotide 5'-kinase involved in rRNA processing
MPAGDALEVIIRGSYNSGKTSLACVITKALAEVGAQVDVQDLDLRGSSTSVSMAMARAEAVVNGKRITIRVEQIPRSEHERK